MGSARALEVRRCTPLAGYLVVYLIGPDSLDWILRTTLDRLLLQIWPSAVFLFFLSLRSPAEMTPAVNW